MEEDKFKDLLEDEELTALRLAALATKKKNEQHLNNPESGSVLPINSIVSTPTTAAELESNQIPFLQSDRSAHNSYSWRKQNQSLRRRGGPFPKNNHRSNLIVIRTLNDGKDSEEKAPALILPQHKWCNSGNDDSLSPKTLRKTGPTRFNRHGSDSESSDESDYELSDNDSGSNETILQDEHPEHFSRLSPGCDNLSEIVEKKRRLSFQNLDSEIIPDTFDKNEATSVYKSINSSLYSEEQHVNEGGQTFNNSDENKYNSCNAGNTKSSELSEDIIFKQNSSIAEKKESCTGKVNALLNQSSDTVKMWQDMDINSNNTCYSKDAENSQNYRSSDGNYNDYVDKRQSTQTLTDMHDSKKSAWQHGEGCRTDNSLYPMERQSISADSRAYGDTSTKSHHPSENDLRLELKKRLLEVKPNSACIETGEVIENRSYYQYNNSRERSRQEESHGSSNHNQQITRSISQERTTHGSFSRRDKNRVEHSFESRRSRYDRSSSLDRNRNVRSSSRGKRSKRSSSRDKKRHERSSSHSKLKHNTDSRPESTLSPSQNQSKQIYPHSKNCDSQSVTEESRNWYKSSPKEKRRRLSNSNHDRKRHEHSLSRNRSRHGSRSPESRSDRSSSVGKGRLSSSPEESKDEESSSESGSRYRFYTRGAFNLSQLTSNQHDITVTEKTSIKETESGQESIQNYNSLRNKKSKYTQNSEKMKESMKINTKDQSKSTQQNRSERSKSKEKVVGNTKPHKKHSRMKNSYKKHYSKSRSSSSESYSSSYSSSSSHNFKPKIRSVPSVIKPVLVKNETEKKGKISQSKSDGKNINLITPQSSIHSVCTKMNLDNTESDKPSNIKFGRMDGDLKASEGKRVPVHMRLGAFPRKRVIQMPKAVKAAFVNSSSSSDGENVNTKCKRQNIRIVTDMYDAKNTIDLIQQKYPTVDKPAKRSSPDTYKEKFKRVKAQR